LEEELSEEARAALELRLDKLQKTQDRLLAKADEKLPPFPATKQAPIVITRETLRSGKLTAEMRVMLCDGRAVLADELNQVMGWQSGGSPAAVLDAIAAPVTKAAAPATLDRRKVTKADLAAGRVTTADILAHKVELVD
jgi:hypothetical protein